MKLQEASDYNPSGMQKIQRAEGPRYFCAARGCVMDASNSFITHRGYNFI